MSALLKSTVLILGLLLAAAAVMGLALAWAGRPAEISGQAVPETRTSSGPSAESTVSVDRGLSVGTQTATFALG